jgi:hypothetical protein
MDDGLISNENSSIMNDLSLVTNYDRTLLLDTLSDEMNFSTINPDVTYDSQTWSLTSFLPTSDLDFITPPEEQWFNVNQSHRRDPYRSVLFWKRTTGNRIFNLCMSLFFVNKLNRSTIMS